MSSIATLSQNNTLQLPVEIAQQFAPSDRFVIWLDGDTMYLKRIMPSPLDIVDEAPNDDDKISLEELDDIVHEVRENRRKSQLN